MARFLAFDLGAESGRGIVAEFAGERLSLREVHRFATHHGRMQGVLQWNLLAIWEEIKTGLRKVASEGLALDGIGVDTWGVDFGFVDARGRIMGNPVHYRDSGHDGMMESVTRVIGRDRMFGMVGIQYLPFNTVFQLSRLLKRGAEVPRGRLLFVPDLLHYLLSGVAENEITIASTSAMIDPQTWGWSRIVDDDELDFPREWFGNDVVAPGTKIGGLLPDVAAETGVAAGTPIIVPASHDTASAVAAVPVGTDAGEWAYLSSGTWSLLGAEIDEPVLSMKALERNFTNEIGVGGKVRLLKNIMGLWLVQEVRRDLARKGTDLDYPELTRLAAEAGGGTLKFLMSSWHLPFGKPGDFLGKIDAYAGATGQQAPTSPGEYVRACLDSLALSYRTVLDELEAITGRRVETLHVVGGGCKNELLNQMTADATGRRVLAGPVEATAIGNALTQALGAGVIASLAEGRRMVANSFEVKVYEPRETERYEAVLPRWRELVAGG